MQISETHNQIRVAVKSSQGLVTLGEQTIDVINLDAIQFEVSPQIFLCSQKEKQNYILTLSTSVNTEQMQLVLSSLNFADKKIDLKRDLD